MACTSRPHPSMNQRDWMEKYVIYRRNREDSIHRKWKEAEKYFKNCEVKCSKYTELSSSECYQASMSAYQERKDKEANEKALNERRKKLSALLQKENEHYEEELKLRLSHRPGKGRFTPAASPSARLLHGIVVPEISDQIANGACSLIQAVPQTVAEVKIHPNAQPEVRDEEPIVVPCPTMDTAVAEIPKVDKPKDGQKPLSDILKDMRRTEQEASALKRERFELQRCLNELREKNLQRGQLIQERQNFKWGKMLMRPYKVQIQMRTRHAIESLEFDLRLINTLLGMLELDGVKDRMLRCELEKVKSRILQDLWRENDVLKESETLFQEEAERLWKCHLQEWEEDRATQDSLIIKASRLIETKLQCRLTEILELQHGNIQDREGILEELRSVRSNGHQAMMGQQDEGSPDTPVGSRASKGMDHVAPSRPLEFPESLSLPEVERLLL